MSTKTDGDDDKQQRKIHFFIDKEKFDVDVEELTVRQLLVDYAKEDPTKTTLGLKDGNEIKKLTNLDEPIKLKNGMKFVVFHNEPTPVS